MVPESDLNLALRSYLQQHNRAALPTILQLLTSTHSIPDGPALATVLHHAISLGDTAGVQAILDAGVPPTLQESQNLCYTPLLNAALHGRRDMARLLWDRVGGPEGRFYPDEPGCPVVAKISCLQVAAAYGHADVVADFLDAWDGWTPDETRQTLVDAAAAWHGDVVDLLLARATADAVQDALAASVGPSNGADDARQYGVVCRLIDAGGDPNGTCRGRPMVVVAASWATSLGVLEALLEKGADPNIQDVTTGRTALHQYRRGPSSSPATAEALLQHGASPDLADREGETPVHSIAFAGDLDDLKLYLAYSRDPAAALRRATSHGESPLHYAAAGGRVDVVEFLLDYGLDVNATNSNGWTPLLCSLMPTDRKHVSAAVEVAELLLSRYGARADAVTDEQWTPMHALASWPANRYGVEMWPGDGKGVVPLVRELIARGAALDVYAGVLRRRDVTADTVRGRWGVRMQRLVVEGEAGGEGEVVREEDTAPHMWAYRTGVVGMFEAVLEHWGKEGR